MARPYIAPLGFIESITEDGATFTLSNPQDSATLKSNTPVTVWRYSPEQLALAKIRGIISAVGYVTATFNTVESLIDPPAGQAVRHVVIVAGKSLDYRTMREPEPE